MSARVLVVSRWLPVPPDNGARIRRGVLLAELAKQFPIHYVALLDASVAADLPSDLITQVPAEVEVFTQPGFRPGSRRALVAAFGRTPRAVVATRSRAVDAHLDEFVRTRRPAVIVADEIHTAHYALGRGVPVIVEELQVGHLADDPTWRGRLTWTKNRDYHRRIMRAMTLGTTPSQFECDRLRTLAPNARIEVVTNGVDTTRLRPQPGIEVNRNLLVYAGSPRFDANLDAVSYFATEILPIVRHRLPDVRLVVTGDTKGVTLPHFEGVEFIGAVDDVATVVRSAACSVVALRRGGGTRIKVLESLALGTPVVATAKGVEGLDLGPHEAAVADTPSGFAEAVHDVLTDADRRAALAESGRDAALRHDWAPVARRWVELVAEVAQGRPV